MSFRNAPVIHKKFGSGVVMSLEGRALTVWFRQYGARTFRFPDIFQTDMEIDDPVFACYAAQAMSIKERGDTK